MAGAAKTVATPSRTRHGKPWARTRPRPRKYEALGYDPASAHDLILARFDYSFIDRRAADDDRGHPLYYFLMLRFSEVEYREVISEKFGEK